MKNKEVFVEKNKLFFHKIIGEYTIPIYGAFMSAMSEIDDIEYDKEIKKKKFYPSIEINSGYVKKDLSKDYVAYIIKDEHLRIGYKELIEEACAFDKTAEARNVSVGETVNNLKTNLINKYFQVQEENFARQRENELMSKINQQESMKKNMKSKIKV